jgi:hypothetical protein
MKRLLCVTAILTIAWLPAVRNPAFSSDAEDSSIAGPASLHASLLDGLEDLCKCDRQFGPPAPVLDPKTLPVDVSLRDNRTCPSGGCQPCFDCYGWQLFISLNWPAKPSGEPDRDRRFGNPGDRGPVVWEIYKSVYDIFGGEPAGGAESRALEATSAVIHQDLVDNRQADHNWLTDQDSKLVRYEIRVNNDESVYIARNGLDNQEGIYKAYTSGGGINLPSGATGGVGAIEIKAAWRIVPEARADYFTRNYKTAMVKIPGENPNGVLVALVGLHIIKKTPKSPQWVWATFEHKDNAPESRPDPGTTYNFFNPSVPGDYKPNYDAPPGRRSDPTRPVQVIRANQTDPRTVAINQAVHELIVSKYPDSVWRNYNLVSVQWPTEPVPVTDPRSRNPLPSGKPAPVVVANTTMETYMQTRNGGGGAGVSPGGRFPDAGDLPRTDANYGKSSCIGCHRLSAVTSPFKLHPSEKKGWSTDYSTIFYKAK